LSKATKFTILIAIILVLAGLGLAVRVADYSAVLNFFSGGGKHFFPLVTVAALVDSINPCAFSVLLITIAFLFSLGKDRTSIVKVGGAYIFGIFAVYLLIGLGILKALTLFNTPHFMSRLGALLLLIFGVITLLDEFFPNFPIRPKIPRAVHRYLAFAMEKASLPAAAILGAMVGVFEFPCSGGPYLLILGFLHDKETYLTGLGYLIYYNLVFVLPLVIILAAASDRALLQRVDNWKKSNDSSMQFWSGVALITLAVLILIFN
jgi:cytochrome c-type biogenesis protein